MKLYLVQALPVDCNSYVVGIAETIEEAKLIAQKGQRDDETALISINEVKTGLENCEYWQRIE